MCNNLLSVLLVIILKYENSFISVYNESSLLELNDGSVSPQASLCCGNEDHQHLRVTIVLAGLGSSEGSWLRPSGLLPSYMASPSGVMLSRFWGGKERLEGCTWACLHYFHFQAVARTSHTIPSNSKVGEWEICVCVQERRGTGRQWYCVSLFQIDSA